MGNCSSTSNCNPCGPDFNAINQLATKAGAYARQANTYSVDAANSAINAENAFLEFNALYLGAFAVAPTVDNEGNPLQEGALYWNTASNELFAWNGTVWVAANFNEFTPFFTQFTSGSGTARSLEIRMREDISSVKDWGAVGNGIADDTQAINDAIQFSQNYIYFPPGSYRVTSPIIIEKSLRLIGAGSHSSFILIDHSGNGIVFQPVGAGTNNVFLNSCSMVDLNITRANSITTPADNIWLRQCNGFRARGVNSNNGNTCFRFTGGQLNSLLQCRAFASNTSITPQAENGLVYIEQAPLSGGGAQPCYTISIDDFIGSSNNVLNYAINIRSIDGLNFSNAYLAFCNTALIGLRRQSASTAVTAINISNVYMDCTGFFGGAGTPHGIICTNGLAAGQYGANGLNVTNCVIANNAAVGQFNAIIDFIKFGQNINIANCYIANSGPEWGVEIHDSSVGGPSGSYTFTGNTFTNLSNAADGGAIYARDVSVLIIDGNKFRNTVTSLYQVLVDGDNGTLSAIGNTTDGSATQMVTIASGATFSRNAVLLNAGQTATNIVQLALPTSSAGLPSGSMWNNAGNVEVVP
jgi:hypothetical protein